MLPRVNVTALYSSNAAFSLAGDYLVIVGPADDGPVNTPTVLTQPSQALSTFGGGPLVQWAAKAIASKRLPVLAVRTAATAVSAFSAVSRTTGHGTSAVTVDESSTTNVNATVELLVHTGGTVGTAGVTYQLSSDGGRSFGSLVALGTATSIVVGMGGTANLTLDLGTGSLVSGELISVTASVIAAGSYGALDTSAYPGGTCTASASIDTSTYPDDDYEVRVRFLTGGALGTAGITYQVSVADGRTSSDWSSVLALGTALSLVIPGSGGVRLVLGTSGQTLAADAELAFRCYAPNFNTGSVSSALAALFQNRAYNWEICAFAGAVDASMALTIDGLFAANFSAVSGGEKYWIANMRMPQAGESTASYMAAGASLSGSARSCFFGSVCFGDCKIVSALTGFLHKRPVALPVALELASVTPNIDIARIDRPALGVLLADDNNNPDCYDDELYNGAMDDYGFITLRTQPEGVFVTNPRIFSPADSTMSMTPHRMVLNLHTRVARAYFRRALSVDLFADKQGHISEADAARLERGVNDAEIDTLRKPGYISNQLITVSRTDDLLNTKPPTLTVSGQVQTKIYPKLINYTDQIVAQISSAR
jgi:hypothetical protein